MAAYRWTELSLDLLSALLESTHSDLGQKKTTRGVRTTSKYWAILFTCLVSRAIHIELVGDMSSEAFNNALRRFMAIRGPVRQFRSDRGTNFIGALKELGISASFDENGVVQDYLLKVGSTWIFNPPYAHHFEGARERLIHVGSCRLILDALLLENRPKDLTFDVLSTFMSEVSAIMNTRPLLPISSDPEAPSVLSPSMILTQKECDLTSSMNITGFGLKDAMKSQWKLVKKNWLMTSGVDGNSNTSTACKLAENGTCQEQPLRLVTYF